MAATRNKNTPGNYFLEQRQLRAIRDNLIYPHAVEAYDTRLPGEGFLPCHLPRDHLSHNSLDTESFLFGIGSTDLAKQVDTERGVLNPALPFVPQQRHTTAAALEANLVTRNRTLLLPDPLRIDPTARPLHYRF